ncbi:MAG: GNAT family N-acetyltransferase [Candidatus Altiarchaeia archaeon]
MEIEKCSKADFDQIITDIEDFWRSKRTLHMHHPTLLYEFGNTAYVIKEKGIVCAYMFAFFSQTGPAGYVQLIAVRKKYRGLGYARRLYSNFEEIAKKNRYTRLKAITSPANQESIEFHKTTGMALTGKDVIEGFPVVLDYSGPGEHRVVFEKEI